MRLLFNHGINPTEIFSGDTRELCDKDYLWFQNNFNHYNESVEAYLGHIFTYALDIIIQYVIEHKVRFNGPFNSFYIDFEMFLDEDFKIHRQRGRMQDIDIVESDFTGYQLTFYYRYSKYDSYYRKRNFYIGKKHRKMFIDKVNSGEKMHSIKDVTITHFLPQIYEKFPKLSKRELKKIISRGLSRLGQAMKENCYASIKSTVLDVTFFIGTVYFNPEFQIKDYYFRMRKKLEKIARWRKDKFDQYYYVGIDKNRMEDWVNLNDKSPKAGWCWVWFEEVAARRLLDSVKYNSTHIYIFKIKVQKKYSKRWNFYIQKAKYRDVQYVGKAINYKFQPATKHWKDLIKEFNETRDSEYL